MLPVYLNLGVNDRSFAVFRVIAQFDFAAFVLFFRVDHATVVRAGIDVQTDGALVEFGGIVDFVDRIVGIDGGG